MQGRSRAWVVALLVAAGGAGIWSGLRSSEERQIRRQVAAFAEAFNGATAEGGVASVTRAARLAAFFTEGAVVELGRGSTPIQGRDTLLGMAARLQPRFAAFALRFEDVTIESLGDDRAEISLTAVIRGRDGTPQAEALDAREFAAELRKVEGAWLVDRVTAVDTLR